MFRLSCWQSPVKRRLTGLKTLKFQEFLLNRQCGYYGRLHQATPCALEYRVVLIRRKIAINTQEVDVVKVFRKCLFVVFRNLVINGSGMSKLIAGSNNILHTLFSILKQCTFTPNGNITGKGNQNSP
ncbi:hypothetical protein JN11_03447 [Mucilaginibacter frigoritolerans]|uniref:Uncharacterized protein n=1 Tax=Mucilaginibacter frigoritolerans TaxID=652788 RepID=A0A562TVP5_9SPHI|nr:hypothetical protein JN11_03447 [Mucilaginibacter frigoritolerans]